MIFENIEVSHSLSITGSFVIPIGPSGSRPSGDKLQTGSLFWNTDSNSAESYNGTVWQTISANISSGPEPIEADLNYLVVAGGGGARFGGGGGGGMLTGSLSSMQSGSSINVVIGGGGIGAAPAATDGGDTSISGQSITTVTACGGGCGGGGEALRPGGDGGSGGGGGFLSSVVGTPSRGTGGSGTTGQGFGGGFGEYNLTPFRGGGGGGAGSAGCNEDAGGHGGDGRISNIQGPDKYYAGGGGGWARSVTPGDGGQGGGSDAGAYPANGPGGCRATGGGGAGDSNGGSGIAVFTIPSGSTLTAKGGYKTRRSDGVTVHTFENSGTLELGGPNDFPIVPNENFDTILYSGTGAARTIQGGWIGKGLEFDGVNDRVDLGPTFAPLNGKNDNSLSLWMKTDADKTGVLFSDYSQGNFHYILYVRSSTDANNPNKILWVNRYNTQTVYLTSTTEVRDGEWHHILCTIDVDDSLKLYVDGVEEDTVTPPSGSWNGPSNIRPAFGVQYLPETSTWHTSNLYEGYIDHARIFDRALTGSEITTLFNETDTTFDLNPFNDSSSIALYQFEDNADNTAITNGFDNLGGAASFDGTNDYITIGTGSSAPSEAFAGTFEGASEWALSGWILSNDTGSSQHIFSKYQSSIQTGGVQILQDSDGTLEFWIADTSDNRMQYNSNTTLVPNEWTHFAMSYNGANPNESGNSGKRVEMWINGTQSAVTLDSSFNTNHTTIPVTNVRIPNRIGAAVYGGGNLTSFWDGEMDNLRFFNKAITQAEVNTMYSESSNTSNITTDILGDGSGIALFEFNNNASASILGTGNYKGTDDLKTEGSVFFDNVDDSFDIESSDLVQNKIKSFSFWFKGKFVISFNDPSGASNSDRRRWFTHNDTDGSIKIEVNNNQYDYEETGITEDNNWHHLVYTDEGKIYLDNSTLTDFNTSYWITDGTNGTQRDTVRVGSTDFIGDADGAYGGPGQLKDLRFYSSSLTSTEVSYLYNNSSSLIDSIDYLQAYYKFNGNFNNETGSYLIENDGATFGYHGTNSGATFGNYNGTVSGATYTNALGFNPDLVWIKPRNDADNNVLTDTVRGTDRAIYTNTTAAERLGLSAGNPAAPSSGLTSFDNNGWSMGTWDNINQNNINYVAWAWKAGGVALENVEGSITSSVSANPDAGFSIVSYTGNGNNSATVGHGLSSAPEMILVKDTGATNHWAAVHTSCTVTGTTTIVDPEYKMLRFDANNAEYDYQNLVVSPGQSSTTFTLGNQVNVNALNNTYIAYCFHSVEGYQDLGSYTGTGGSVDVELGFSPSWIMIKRIDAIEDWKIIDNKRDNFLDTLEANENIAEENNNNSNFIPTFNGFQVNDTSGDFNANGGTYIYLAIA